MEDAFILALKDRQAYGQAATQLADVKLRQDSLLDYARQLLAQADEELENYKTILTNPNILANYTCDFFGPDGPYPSVSRQEAAYNGYPSQQPQQYQPQQQSQPQQFQRPTISMPQPGGNQGESPASFWARFSEIADVAPTQAWQYLAQATPEVLRAKTLVVQ
ncbi:hypothetical protein VZG28_05045 [Synechococcus elongatus IITB4]|uniref:hypothetical protein n=1 Tax=Synechococcus elongatus TaxID=32046 RepID=UPI0030CBB04B